MQRKKEMLFIIILGFICLIFGIISFMQKKPKKEVIEEQEAKECIVLKIEGEVVRPMELFYTKPVSYGVVLLQIGNNINEYSDISGFSLDELIYESQTIYIPSLDGKNSPTSDVKICINSAGLNELVLLPQIGEKRAQKILDYIKSNGRITSWEIFFKIVGVPENAKAQIQQQAFL